MKSLVLARTIVFRDIMAKVLYRKTQCLYNNPDKGVSVHQAISSPGDQMVAIKEIQARTMSSVNSAVQEALNQAKLYCMDGVVRVYTCKIEESEGVYTASIIQELMDTDLHAEIERRKVVGAKWTEQQLLTMFTQIVTVLSQAQALDLSHRDIKPQNIYLKAAQIKLGDFGSSAICDFESLKSTLQGSPFFLSPELKQKYLQFLSQPNIELAYDPFKSDVYSLGLTFGYMITLDPPSALAKIEGLEEETKEYVSALPVSGQMKEVLREMLQVNPVSRPSFEAILVKLNSVQITEELQALAIQEKPAAEAKLPAARSKRAPSNCYACHKQLPIPYEITDPALMEIFRKVQPFFCSEYCLRNFSVVCTHTKCLQCNTDMIHGVLGNGHKNKILRKNFILLKCGHMFHTANCFHNFITTLPDPSTAACPACKLEIGTDMLQKWIGKKKLQRAQTMAAPAQKEETKGGPAFTKSASQEGWD